MKLQRLIEFIYSGKIFRLKLEFKAISNCIAIIFFLFANLYAQDNEFEFTNLTAEDGLSLSAVTKIIQDDKGFLWFGTYNGLNRYDGYNFKIFLPDPSNTKSISNHSTWALLKDSKGFIWIGTLDGLNRYDWKTDQFYKYTNNPHDANSISSSNILSIFEDESGTLWIGTVNGLNKYNRDKDNFTVIKKVTDRLNEDSLNTVTCIEEDYKGNLWLGTWNGLTCMQTDGKVIKQFFSEENNSKIVDYRKIQTLFEDKENNLWIGTSVNGIIKYNHVTGKFVNYVSIPGNPNTLSNGSITTIFKDKSGNLWIGTKDGLNKYNFKSDNFIRILHDPQKPLSIINNEILSINEDNTGLIWIGSAGGLSRIFQPINKFNYYQQGNEKSDKNLISNRVHSVFIDKKGNIWVATFDGLDEIINGKNIIIHHSQHSANTNSLSDNFLMSVIEDNQGYIWAGTFNSGLNRFDPNKGEFKLFKHMHNDVHSLSNNGIVSLCEDHTGTLWVGTWWGLNRFDRKNGTCERYFHDPANSNSLCHDLIWAVFEDSKDMLWFGTDGGGASEFDPKSNKFITFSRESSIANHISENRVFTIFESHDGIIWLGTSDGLNAYNRKTGKITIYNKLNGLAGNSISSIQEDNKGYLWIGTDNGLSKFDRKASLFINYTKRNGLKDLEFVQNSASKSSKDGKFYFACKSGLLYFDPVNIKDEYLEAPVVLTDLKIFNQSIPITKDGILQESISSIKSIPIPSGNDVITFEFALLDYYDVKKNTFRYKLDGFDIDWNNVGSRNNATYTNLPPGKYTFFVKATNGNGIKNESESSVRIIIIPTFYQTWWFDVVLVFAVLFIIVIVFQVRTRSIQNRNKMLEHRVIERTKDLDKTIKELNMEIATKDKFFSIIAHDLRSPFMALLGFSNHMVEEINILSKEDIKTIAGNILRSTKVTLGLLENLLQWARIKTGRITFEPEVIHLKKTIDETTELFKNNAASKGIILTIDVDNETKIFADLNMVETILRNIITNSVKFTNSGGRINISAKEEKDFVVICVSDTGMGMSPDKIKRLFQIGQDISTLGTENEKGSGLGLILCKEFVEMNQGKISVKSKLGEGTEFSFTLQTKNNKPS
jgi:ligand-binding sensor domain-containing protein/signal transduction histidine kinase